MHRSAPKPPGFPGTQPVPSAEADARRTAAIEPIQVRVARRDWGWLLGNEKCSLVFEHLADLAPERLRAEWFVQERNPLFEHAVVDDGVLAVP